MLPSLLRLVQQLWRQDMHLLPFPCLREWVWLALFLRLRPRLRLRPMLLILLQGQGSRLLLVPLLRLLVLHWPGNAPSFQLFIQLQRRCQ